MTCPEDVADLITAAANTEGGYSGLFSASSSLSTIGPAYVTWPNGGVVWM